MLGTIKASVKPTVDIHTKALNSFSSTLPPSQYFPALAAVEVDLNNKSSKLPVRLGVKLANSIDPTTGQAQPLANGTEVLFWRRGKITDAQGNNHDTWWLLDIGSVQNGMAYSATLPYPGIFDGGSVLVTGTTISNLENPNQQVDVSGIEDNTTVFWSQSLQLAMYANAQMPFSVVSVLVDAPQSAKALSYSVEGFGEQSLTTNDLDKSKSKLKVPSIVNENSGNKPVINLLDYDPVTRKLTLTGVNFLPPNGSANNFSIKVWLDPRGDQIDEPTATGVAPDRGLIWQALTPTSVSATKIEVTVPVGVALSQHYVYVERRANIPKNGTIKVSEAYATSQLAATWSVEPYKTP